MYVDVSIMFNKEDVENKLKQSKKDYQSAQENAKKLFNKLNKSSSIKDYEDAEKAFLAANKSAEKLRDEAKDVYKNKGDTAFQNFNNTQEDINKIKEACNKEIEKANNDYIKISEDNINKISNIKERKESLQKTINEKEAAKLESDKAKKEAKIESELIEPDKLLRTARTDYMDAQDKANKLYAAIKESNSVTEDQYKEAKQAFDTANMLASTLKSRETEHYNNNIQMIASKNMSDDHEKYCKEKYNNFLNDLNDITKDNKANLDEVEKKKNNPNIQQSSSPIDNIIVISKPSKIKEKINQDEADEQNKAKENEDVNVKENEITSLYKKHFESNDLYKNKTPHVKGDETHLEFENIEDVLSFAQKLANENKNYIIVDNEGKVLAYSEGGKLCGPLVDPKAESRTLEDHKEFQKNKNNANVKNDSNNSVINKPIENKPIEKSPEVDNNKIKEVENTNKDVEPEKQDNAPLKEWNKAGISNSNMPLKEKIGADRLTEKEKLDKRVEEILDEHVNNLANRSSQPNIANSETQEETQLKGTKVDDSQKKDNSSDNSSTNSIENSNYEEISLTSLSPGDPKNKVVEKLNDSDNNKKEEEGDFFDKEFGKNPFMERMKNT